MQELTLVNVFRIAYRLKKFFASNLLQNQGIILCAFSIIRRYLPKFSSIGTTSYNGQLCSLHYLCYLVNVQEWKLLNICIVILLHKRFH